MDAPKKPAKPFYALPEKTPTSSQIINAARTSLRTFDTRRPNTPRDEQRHLFPSSTNRAPDARPPSAFSLTSRHFDGPDSRPVSGTRLSPLDHQPRVSQADLDNILVPRPPPSDPSKGSQRRGSVNRARVERGERAPSTVGSDLDVGGRGVQGEEVRDAESARDRDSAGPLGYTDTARGDQGRPGAPSSAGSEGRSNSAGSRKSSAGKSSRTSSAGKRDEVSEDIYTTHIEPLVTEMSSLAKKKDCPRMHILAGQLYSALETHNCLTRQLPQRPGILKIIFKLLDVDEPRVLLRMARLILAFKVTGNNLLNVCKLVFKVSRNDKNDAFFLEENILNLLLDTVRSTDPATACEALIYCVGAVKFLTGNPDILKRLAKLDCVKTLATLMHSINRINREMGKPCDQYGHILVQLAAALRNLADTSSGRDRFLTHHVIDGLVVLMEAYPGDGDLMLYISRILSKVTLHTDCCSVLANQHTCYRAFITLLKQHLLKDDLIVRLCFVLGNLTIKNDAARLKLFQEIDSIETLLNILKTYCLLDRQGNTTSRIGEEGGGEREGEDTQVNGGEGGQPVTKVEDVLVKVMRVLANLSINEDVGPAIAGNPDFTHLLISVIDDKEVTSHEEVVVNAVVAVNNVSYYTTQDDTQMATHLKMASSLLKLVMIDNTEGILEAVRVFGNLTRHKEVRDYLAQNKVDAMMMTLLDSGDRELVYIACGVLINFMLDDNKRDTLRREGGIQKLTDVLRDFGRSDWQLSGCVCKVLVNYSSKMTSSSRTFGATEASQLTDLLLEYLDKSSALGPDIDEDMSAYMEDVWQEEFLPVGEQLLRRIEAHSCDLEPLEQPS